MSVQEARRPQGGQLLTALAQAVVAVQRDYIGRGPTSARASISEDTVCVVLRDTMTKAEHSLARSGEAELVLTLRSKFQEAMRNDLVSAIERLTGRSVIAFMSANHIEPDMAAEIFVLAPDVHGADGVSPDGQPPAAAA
jgi:uncharacterized protein YbcI